MRFLSVDEPNTASGFSLKGHRSDLEDNPLSYGAILPESVRLVLLGLDLLFSDFAIVTGLTPSISAKSCLVRDNSSRSLVTLWPYIILTPCCYLLLLDLERRILRVHFDDFLRLVERDLLTEFAPR